MIKRDSEGNRLWEMPIEGMGVFAMNNISDGNIILCGRADYNPALRKITPEGEIIWTNIIDTDSGIAFSVTETNDNGFSLTGVNYGDNDLLVIKTNSVGDSIWSRTYEGLGRNDEGDCIIETNNNDLIVGGRVRNLENRNRGFLWKLDPLGNTIWTHYYEDGPIYYLNSLVQSLDGNYVIQGNHLLKTNEQQNILWSEDIEGSKIGQGDRNLHEYDDGGFVYVSGDFRNIWIVKTDENGLVNGIGESELIENDLLKMENYPNSFNPQTTISFELPPNISDPLIEIFNIKGQSVTELRIMDEELRTNSVVWDAEDNPSGVYFYRLKGDSFTSNVRKMLLLK